VKEHNLRNSSVHVHVLAHVHVCIREIVNVRVHIRFTFIFIFNMMFILMFSFIVMQHVHTTFSAACSSIIFMQNVYSAQMCSMAAWTKSWTKSIVKKHLHAAWTRMESSNNMQHGHAARTYSTARAYSMDKQVFDGNTLGDVSGAQYKLTDGKTKGK
jgi:hypothetical protein